MYLYYCTVPVVLYSTCITVYLQYCTVSVILVVPPHIVGHDREEREADSGADGGVATHEDVQVLGLGAAEEPGRAPGEASGLHQGGRGQGEQACGQALQGHPSYSYRHSVTGGAASVKYGLS